MKNKPFFTLYKKEIMDLLRDKKTIIIMILVPLFLYPTMMIASLLITTGIAKESIEKEYQVAVVKTDVSDEVFDVLTDESDDYDYHFKKIEYESLDDAKTDLTEKKVDLVLDSKKIPADKSLVGLDHLFEVTFYDLSATTNSMNACQNAETVLKAYSKNIQEDAIRNLFDDPEQLITPVLVNVESISTTEENAGYVIGMVLPFILIISILTGAIYPAIDATAGERERGTLETIMTLPVRKSDIMISKFLSVSTIAVVSAILNIVSMLVVVLYMYRIIDIQGLGLSGLDLKQFVPAFISLIICLPVFSMFTSAVCLCVCIFAKSFKEANNISSPIMIVFMFASMLSILPNMKLTEKTALIPVTNISLLIKSVFSLDYDIHLVAIVLFSNLFYCVVMVVLMSTLFSSEDVLFGESAKGVHIFERRANIEKGQIPGYGDLCLLFAGLMLLIVYVGSLMTIKFGILGSLVVQILVFTIPLLYAIYIRCDLKSLYSIKLPKIRQALGSIVIWAGAFLICQTLLALLSTLFPVMTESSEMISESITDAGFIPAILVVGICPAIAEEGAFRGFLFGTLKSKTKLMIAVLISAAVFGIYHMNLLQFFTGLFMGIVMALMVYKSGSIFTSVIFHMLNNSLAVIAEFYPDLILKIPIIGSAEPGVGGYAIMFIAGSVLLMLGILLFGITFRKPVNENNTTQKSE
ncbi:MAG: CPBP family intramembrane metalloprotease [Lachnospiraceae bacterium]|nr:CPBP family intramembrane metalloprotease [Lachnospiraceae bacterium]